MWQCGRYFLIVMKFNAKCNGERTVGIDQNWKSNSPKQCGSVLFNHSVYIVPLSLGLWLLP